MFPYFYILNGQQFMTLTERTVNVITERQSQNLRLILINSCDWKRPHRILVEVKYMQSRWPFFQHNDDAKGHKHISDISDIKDVAFTMSLRCYHQLDY